MKSDRQRRTAAETLRRIASKHPRWIDANGVSQPMYKHPLYYVHKGMMQRCTVDATYSRFESYGGRGIQVHEPWHSIGVFIAYIEEKLPERKPGDTLDRTDNDGNYEPGNVRWADALQQARNRRERQPASRVQIELAWISAGVALRRRIDWRGACHCEFECTDAPGLCDLQEALTELCG